MCRNIYHAQVATLINTVIYWRHKHMSLPRSGAMNSQEVVTGNIEFYTLFTTINITQTGDYTDDTQKDFESVVQVIGLRAMPIIMNSPVGINLIENFGAPTLSGPGWIFKFAFEREAVHTLDSLRDELDGIVLNGGTIDTKNTVNMEFTKQDLL